MVNDEPKVRNAAREQHQDGARSRIAVAALALLLWAVRVSASEAIHRTEIVRDAVRGDCPRNIILMIGDGMGDSEITSARNFHVGAAGHLALDGLPLTGAYTTYAVEEVDPSMPEYVVDSAASATAWSTGHKTSLRRLSTSANEDRPLTTILELARQHGLRTGNVTTAELTDATPAAQIAHINDRGCQGPADMAACPQYRRNQGGAGSIAEQAIEHRFDVLFGGGRERFEQIMEGGGDAGKSVVDAARDRGYTVVTTAGELAAIRPGTPVLGLFTPASMTVAWRGELAKEYPGSGPQRCEESRRSPDEPTLAAMTEKALALLNDGKSKGFFLQVEGASIDKQNHAFDPCGQIGEVVGFDAAVAVARAFAQEHDDTLVIVTGDHGHSSQIVSSKFTAEDHPAGMFSTLITKDGAKMTLSYATNGIGRRQAHTGTQIRIAAEGPRAAEVVGLTDQTDLFYTMARGLDLIEGGHCGFWNRMERALGLD